MLSRFSASLRLGGEHLALALFTPLKQNKEKEFQG
jgi:hypothetical protein